MYGAEEALNGAEVVAATCIGAGDLRLAGRAFKLCALDEATQVPAETGLDYDVWRELSTKGLTY